MRRSGFLLLALAACSRHGTNDAGTPRGDAATEAPAISPELRRTVFDRLVAAVARYHVFAPALERNFGAPWASRVPALRAEFDRAGTRGQLLTAINHFANSLHNPHCSFNSPTRPVELFAGFDVRVEWNGAEPAWVVDSVASAALRDRVAPGDRVIGVGEVDARDFARRFELESGANQPRTLVYDVARFLTRRASLDPASIEGSETEFRFARGAGEAARPVRVRWERGPAAATWDDAEVNYDDPHCGALPDRVYGRGYRIVGVGRNFCVYASAESGELEFPVVRYHSFWYPASIGAHEDPRVLVRADYESLRAALARVTAGARGVLLDLRDNRGGNNPLWFLDWFAPEPLAPLRISLPLVRDWRVDFADVAAFDHAVESGTIDEAYARAAEDSDAGSRFTAPRPFGCGEHTCDAAGVFTPRHRVTTLPVALLVGPRCMSACDTFARYFDENEFGPLVGEVTGAAYTVTRLRYDVAPPGSGMDLGFVRLAFAREVSARTGEMVEGVPLHIDARVEPSASNRGHEDVAVVDAARAALGAWRGMR